MIQNSCNEHCLMTRNRRGRKQIGCKLVDFSLEKDLKPVSLYKVKTMIAGDSNDVTTITNRFQTSKRSERGNESNRERGDKVANENT